MKIVERNSGVLEKKIVVSIIYNYTCILHDPHECMRVLLQVHAVQQ